MKFYKFIIIICLFFAYSIISQEKEPESIPEIHSIERNKQGEVYLSKAFEYYKDGNYKACIERILEFNYLFLKHSSYLKSMQLLSRAYKKDDQIMKSIQTDIQIYRDFPVTEDGLNSYLNAGRKLVLTGQREEAKKVFEELKKQLFSYKISKEAEIELNQLELTNEKPIIEKPLPEKPINDTQDSSDKQS